MYSFIAVLPSVRINDDDMIYTVSNV